MLRLLSLALALALLLTVGCQYHSHVHQCDCPKAAPCPCPCPCKAKSNPCQCGYGCGCQEDGKSCCPCPPPKKVESPLIATKLSALLDMTSVFSKATAVYFEYAKPDAKACWDASVGADLDKALREGREVINRNAILFDLEFNIDTDRYYEVLRMMNHVSVTKWHKYRVYVAALTNSFDDICKERIARMLGEGPKDVRMPLAPIGFTERLDMKASDYLEKMRKFWEEKNAAPKMPSCKGEEDAPVPQASLPPIDAKLITVVFNDEADRAYLEWSDGGGGGVRRCCDMSLTTFLANAPREDETVEAAAPTATEALDEVNAARAKKGLPAFQRDADLTTAAKACAAYRAQHGTKGHSRNDFAFLPAGATAKASGCGALTDNWGWQTCCAWEKWTYAGAAWARGKDRKLRFMQLFVR